MNHLLVLVMALTIALAPRGCKQNNSAMCYKGRLEVKGICGNYTIKLLEGGQQEWVQPTWTDEQTGKAYTQVFKLANPCSFPENIKEGDTFYFSVDTTKQSPCTVCMAFYPTPEKSANIKVLSGSCK